MIKWFIINSHEIFSISWGWRLGWVGHGTGLSHWKIGSRSSRKWEMEKSGRVEKISISRSWIGEWLSITKLCFFKPYPMCDKLCWNSSCYLVTTFFANRFPAGPPLRNAFGEVLRPLLRFIVILSPAWHEPVNQNRYFDKEQLILSANFSQLPDAKTCRNSKVFLFQPSFSAISTHRVATAGKSCEVTAIPAVLWSNWWRCSCQRPGTKDVTGAMRLGTEMVVRYG